jgi:LmbE family N-acetylglucosaminyl deacetylase
MRRFLLSVFVLVTALTSRAQHQLQPVAAMRGEPALELALRKLDTVGTLMMTTAHPDDENNAMLAYYGHGKGFRTALVTATRGEGGQNEIGPELFEALAVLRTEELLAAHRYDGAEQYFTRAVDFGYSFGIEETLEKWGHQEILGDFVRMIRTIRPDVIVGFVFDGEGGGQHHQTSARLTLEAFRAAADPARFPEQIAEGLRPWQPKKYYYTAGFGGPGPGGGRGGPRPAQLTGEGAKTPLMFEGGAHYDPVLGRTCNEVSAEARSMHKCQGMSQLLPLPDGEIQFGGVRAYRLRDTVLPDGVDRVEKEPFDGIDTSLSSLATFAGANPPAALSTALSTISNAVKTARSQLSSGGNGATVPSLAEGLTAVRRLRRDLASMPIEADGRFEIDFRLAQKEAQFSNALLLAADIKLDAVATDGLVVAGQPVEVRLSTGVRGSVPVQVTSRGLNGFAQDKPEGLSPRTEGLSPPTGQAPPTRPGRSPAPQPGAPESVALSLSSTILSAAIPPDARPTAAHFKYARDAARFVLDPDVPFGLPFRPTPFTATFAMSIGGVEVTTTVPVQFRSEGNLFSGEKRHELHVVPAFAVTASPEIVIVPGRAAPANVRGQTKDIRVTVINHTSGAARAEVALELPQGWRAAPATQPISFSKEDEATTVRFVLDVPPPPVVAAAMKQSGSNTFAVKAVVRPVDFARTTATPVREFRQGYQVVEYPHTTRRHVIVAPEVTVKALDVSVKPNLSVGYIMGVGDEVPAALEQLGVKLSFIGADDLAWGDLSRFDVIVTGVRAYERRSDLRAYNHRLLEFARTGGTVIVQYNKFEFNDAQYGPYPGRVGRERVTDENAEPRVLVPGHPVFTSPNVIGRTDWLGWVQERGLYFFDTAGRDPRYVDLVELNEPFPYNQGSKRGALVEARIGEGRWIYVGLGLWRQLPAGTDGAFRIMANLLSLGRAPASSPAAPRQ